MRSRPGICHPRPRWSSTSIDGTYELFRHFYGRRSGGRQDGEPFGAAAGVLHTVLQMLESGATHVGVATDHVIESFRNELWPGYKTGAGVDPRAARAVRAARGGARGDGRRSSGRWSSSRPTTRSPRPRASPTRTTRVQQVCIWTPDKDLAQCVRGDRVVQVDRRSNSVRNADGVREKFGVEPARIPDLLALVGDTRRRLPGHSRHRQGHGGAARDRTARSRSSRPRCSATSASSHCCSRIWRRCDRPPRCSATSTSCAGTARLGVRRMRRAPRRPAPARPRARGRGPGTPSLRPVPGRPTPVLRGHDPGLPGQDSC